jgi:FixJ family two-component response regulator
MDMNPTVFIVDDDESVGRALARVLEAERFSCQVWSSPRAFLAQHDPAVPGCLVTDLIMPEMSGLELQRALQVAGSARPVVFVTARGDMTTAVAGMRAGAVNFLPKPVRSAELVGTVREALANDASARSLTADRRCVSDRLRTLTPRERQVLELVIRGYLNKQIAAELGAAEKTIKVHRGRLMHKMKVRSVAALVSLLPHAAGEFQEPPVAARNPWAPEEILTHDRPQRETTSESTFARI